MRSQPDMAALTESLHSFDAAAPVAERLLLMGRRDRQHLEGLSIITIADGSPERFCRMADSLPAHAFPTSDLVLERLLVNCGGDQRTAAEADRRTWTVVEPLGGVGIAAAWNLGVRESHTSHLVLLRSGCVLHPGALDQLWARRFYPFVAPVLLDAAGRIRSAGGVFAGGPLTPAHHAHGSDPATLERGDRYFPWAAGACMLLSRPFWRDVGGMDEGYGRAYEDVDLSLRALERGARVLVTLQAVVTQADTAPPDVTQKVRDAARFTTRWLQTGRLHRALGIQETVHAA